MCQPLVVSDIPEFETREAASEWMSEAVDDPCVDNHRFAYVDDAAEMQRYSEKMDDGCCGFFDQAVIIAGRLATIGCNYGH